MRFSLTQQSQPNVPSELAKVSPGILREAGSTEVMVREAHAPNSRVGTRKQRDTEQGAWPHFLVLSVSAKCLEHFLPVSSMACRGGLSSSSEQQSLSSRRH